MESFGVVESPPVFDNDLGFTQRVKDLVVQELVAYPAIEALTVSVFPEWPGLDVGSLCPNRLDPVSDSLSDELRAIVRPNVGGHSPQDEQVCQSINDLSRVELPFNPDRQAFPAVFVQDIEGPERPAIIGSVMHKVV